MTGFVYVPSPRSDTQTALTSTFDWAVKAAPQAGMEKHNAAAIVIRREACANEDPVITHP
jgi:hypothetical protein